MTNINFDEAYIGEVTADNKAALKVKNKGNIMASGIMANLHSQ
jgi:hypothetical protein